MLDDDGTVHARHRAGGETTAVFVSPGSEVKASSAAAGRISGNTRGYSKDGAAKSFGWLAGVVCSVLLLFLALWSFTSVSRRLAVANRDVRALSDEIETLRSLIDTITKLQEAQSENINGVKSSLAQKQGLKSDLDSFDAKISSLQTSVAKYQEDVKRWKETSDNSDVSSRLQIVESQIEMFRRMFGLGATSNNYDETPPQQQQQQAGGGLPRQEHQAWSDDQAQVASSPPPRLPRSIGNAGAGAGAAALYGPGGLPPHQPPSARDSQPVRNDGAGFVVHPPLIDRAADIPDVTNHLPETERNAARAEAIKKEFTDSWGAYKQYAWGHDELCPNSKSHKDWGGAHSQGLALTALDALSTLHIMGLTTEFEEAVKLVTQYVDYDQDIKVSVFETTIRVVAGLLSAFELSGEENRELLETAAYVMDKLLWAFNTTTGIPHQTLNLKTHQHWNPDWTNGASVLSEFGSIQLELRTLSFHTKDPVYDMKATHLMDILVARCPDMMCPTMFDVANAEARSDQITLGALGDSYFEYLVKQYLLTDKSETKYRDMALKALEAIRVRLLRYSTPSHQAYVGELNDGMLDGKMDHLACFTGGMYALAAMHLASDADVARSYETIAADLTETCFLMYDSQATGIAPEIVEFAGGQDFHPGEAYYLLRPETVESIFYMWRLTKKEKYRSYQWKIFQHLKEYCKSDVTGAYSGITMVSIVPPEQDDLMQSFWMAETMKYLYLTFVDDSTLDLREWVLNTEAHPLKIRRRDPIDIWREWELNHGGVLPWYPPTVEGVAETETETMLRERLANGGNYHRFAPRDPLGDDMRQPDDGEAGDSDKVPFDPNENVYARRPTRHDVKRRKFISRTH